MKRSIIPRSTGYLDKVARYRALRGTAIKVQKRFEQALRCSVANPHELRRLQEQAGDCWTQCGRARSELVRARCAETKRMEVAA